MNMFSLHLLLAILAGLIVLFPLFFLWRKEQAVFFRMAHLEPALPGFKMRYLLNVTGRGILNGFLCGFLVTFGGRRIPPVIDIIVRCKTSFKMYIVKRTKQAEILSFFAKPVMYKRAFTHDPDFDEKYIIWTDAPELVPGYFYNTQRKSAADMILSRSFSRITFDYHGILARKPQYTLDEDIDPRRIRDILDALVVLSLGFGG